jgi:hypothetical protein
LKLTAEVRVALWFITTLIAVLGIGSAAVTLSNPAYVEPLKVFLIGGFLGIAMLDAIGIGLAVRKTPIPKGMPLMEGLRRAMIAYDARAAWVARHPWLMTGMTVVGWTLVSIGAAARLAFYAAH